MEFTKEELANEEWRDVVGYEGLYQVSSLGRVRKFDGKLLRKSKNYAGYRVVSLNKKQFRVARLVATSFIPNINNLPQVDHIDTIKSNDKVNNLRWVTPKGNMNNPLTLRKVRESKLGSKNPNFGRVYTLEEKRVMSDRAKQIERTESWRKKLFEKRFRKEILQYDTNGVLVKKWHTMKDASEHYGISKTKMSNLCNHYSDYLCNGYLWCYANDTKRIAEIENLRKKTENSVELFAN